MTSFTDAEAVTDEAERAAVAEILGAFASFREWEATLSQYNTVQASSPFSTDDAALQSIPVSQFAYAHLVVAFGCLQSLRQMLVDEDNGKRPCHFRTQHLGSQCSRCSCLCTVVAWAKSPGSMHLAIKGNRTNGEYLN